MGETEFTSRSDYDGFGRKSFDELKLGKGFISRQFSYHAGKVTEVHKNNDKLQSAPVTQLVSQIILSDGRTLNYEYDKEERVTKVIDSTEGTTEYTYDALGQLLSETKNGQVINTMTYDNYGNILTKNGKAYTYGDNVWKDKLTKFDGLDITYDSQGNPLNYLGHTLSWEKGRQLKSFDTNTYTYNANGIRTSKTVDGVRHNFTLDGAKILKETWENNTLTPLYDNADEVCGIIYNNTPYFFIKNLQGDVIAITDDNGETVAKYSYDAWGVCTVEQDLNGIANINPYRYRSYYYDSEIGMYYLQSRYYNPNVGRFVNGDDILDNRGVLGLNLFAYCWNRPAISIDPNGHWVFAVGLTKTSPIFVSIGLNFSAIFLVDSKKDVGLFICATYLSGLISKGNSVTYGFYWRFKTISDYLCAETVSYNLSNAALICEYVDNKSNKKYAVGIQIGYSKVTYKQASKEKLPSLNLYKESAPFKESIYIDLKKILSNVFKKCGSNKAKLIAQVKRLKIKIKKR